MLFKVKQRGAEDTKWRHERLKQAATYFARALKIPRPKVLDITLKLSSDKKMLTEDYRGECRALPSYVNGNPHVFEIVIQRDMPWSWTINTFAHEMVHVKQQVTGKLCYKWDWNAQKYFTSWDNGPLVDKDTIPYCQRPWEIEAMSLENKLEEGFYKVEEPVGNFYYTSV